MTTDTPRTDACPHCRSMAKTLTAHKSWYACGTYHIKGRLPARTSLCCEIQEKNELKERAEKAEAEVERFSKLTEDCLNVIRVHCPTYYNDAMERFNKTNK